MSTADKKIIKINASAGSGKTHTLKERFLKLLANANLHIQTETYALKNIDNYPTPLHKYNFSEILALTFTNIAANEMQERVILTLKKIALGIEKDKDNLWTQEKAQGAINLIFKQYSAFNIKTIDSLLHQIVRLCALELEVSPEFSVTFNNESIINPVFKDFAQKARKNEELAKLFDEICQSIIEYKKPFTQFLISDSLASQCSKIIENYIQEKENFFNIVYDTNNPYYLRIQELSKKLGKQNNLTSLDYLYSEIEQLIKKLQETEKELCDKILTPKKELITLYENAKNSMIHAAQEILECLESENLSPLENFLKAVKFVMTGIYKESTYFSKKSLDDCLKATSKEKATKKAMLCYTTLCQNIANFYAIHAIIPSALINLPLLELSMKIEEKVWEYEKEKGILLSARIPSLVSKVLHDEHYLSATFCRLGANLNHILFDEFQDTSTPQWQALSSLAKEALSINGSVFFVGDVKQAIYGWRGGDADLFDLAPNSLKKSISPTQFQDSTLERNWRSDENIIEWNNAFFKMLTEENLKVAFEESFLLEKEALLKKIPHLGIEIEDCYAHCLTKITSSYKDVAQKTAYKTQEKSNLKREIGKQGLVQIHTINLPKEKVNLGILALLAPAIHTLHAERGYCWSDICVLTITNKQASLVSEALLSQGIAVVSQGSLFMAEHPIIQEVIACMRFLANPMNEQAFFEVLSSEYLLPIKIDKQILLDFAVEKRKKSLFSCFKETFPEEWDYLFKALVDSAGLLTAYDSLCEIYKRFEMRSRHNKSDMYLLRLLEIVHLVEENKCLDLLSFLDWWDCHGKEEKAPLPKDTGAVSVMTVHKAKGLEFKVVLIPWHNFIVKPDLETPQKIQYIHNNKSLFLFSRLMKEHGRPYFHAYFTKVIESINTLYVAWTRAKKELHIFMPEEAPGRDNVFPKFLEALLRELYYSNNTNAIDKKNSKNLSKKLDIETFDDFTSFGAIFNNETKTENKCSIINPLYLRTLEYLLCQEENKKDTLENAKVFFKNSGISLNILEAFDKEELENAKSADFLYYAKQINFLFQKLKKISKQKKKNFVQEENFSENNLQKEAHIPSKNLALQKQALRIPSLTRPMDWLPRLKIFRNNLNDLYLNQEDTISANQRGTLMHKCLETLIYSGDIENDTKRAINAVFGYAALPTSAPFHNHTVHTQEKKSSIHTYQSIDKKEFENAISWFLKLEKPFGGTKEWLKYSLKEHALVSKEGKMFRVDLLVNRPHFIRQDADTIELLAIDYKTGYQGDLPDRHNVLQIKNYLALLNESISKDNKNSHNKVQGMLIYLDRKEIHLIEL